MSGQQNKNTHPNRLSDPSIDKRGYYTSILKLFLENAFNARLPMLIPTEEIDHIYITRLIDIELTPAPGHSIAPNVLSSMKLMAVDMLNVTHISTGLDEPAQLPLLHYLSLVFTMIKYNNNLDDKKYDTVAGVKNALSTLAAYEYGEAMQQAWQKYKNIMQVIALLHSDLGSCCYIIKHRPGNTADKKPGLLLHMEVYALKTATTDRLINGAPRTLYRLGIGMPFPQAHIQYVNARYTNGADETSLPVYVIPQALKRLQERVDDLYPGLLQASLAGSFLQLRTCTSPAGELLFEYRLFNYKVGYFTGQIADNTIILINFLFLTNNLTPEYALLHSSNSLTSQDKNYLNLNKLSTFVLSDIRNNPAAKQAFEAAGFHDLLSMDKQLLLSGIRHKERLATTYIVEELLPAL